MKRLSVIIPVYNESEGIANVLRIILGVLDALKDFHAEILVVDDGSTDATTAAVYTVCAEDRRVEILCLNRNFGKEAAIHAGLTHARGDLAIVIDGDLQHPPELIPRMVALWQQGLPVVEAVKRSRGRESLLSALLASGFYRAFASLAGLDIRNHTDFKLLDRAVVDGYLQLPERRRFFRGLVPWMGFPSAQLPFDVPERRTGRSTFNGWRLLRLSTDALTAFSSAPLQVMTLLGALMLLLAVVIGGIAIYDKLTGGAVSGFTTVILLILIVGSFMMVGLGLIGLYLAQIFYEVKQRPPWLVDKARSRRQRDR